MTTESLAREARRPLAGVRVVDETTRLAGGYAAKLLHDVGADVVVTHAGDQSPVDRWLRGGQRRVDAAAARQLRDLADIMLVDNADAGDARGGTVTVTITDFGRTGPWAGRPA
jgi:crotonobetainyl-CoA:carnitine CoA-transferase CaiB-like acyl-CoA transferase